MSASKQKQQLTKIRAASAMERSTSLSNSMAAFANSELLESFSGGGISTLEISVKVNVKKRDHCEDFVTLGRRQLHATFFPPEPTSLHCSANSFFCSTTNDVSVSMLSATDVRRRNDVVVSACENTAIPEVFNRKQTLKNDANYLFYSVVSGSNQRIECYQIFFDNETKSDCSWLVGQLILDHLSSSAAGPLVNFFVDEIKQRLYVIEADQPQQRLRIFIQQLIVNKESFTGYAPDFVRYSMQGNQRIVLRSFAYEWCSRLSLIDANTFVFLSTSRRLSHSGCCSKLFSINTLIVDESNKSVRRFTRPSFSDRKPTGVPYLASQPIRIYRRGKQFIAVCCIDSMNIRLVSMNDLQDDLTGQTKSSFNDFFDETVPMLSLGTGFMLSSCFGDATAADALKEGKRKILGIVNKFVIVFSVDPIVDVSTVYSLFAICPRKNETPMPTVHMTISESILRKIGSLCKSSVISKVDCVLSPNNKLIFVVSYTHRSTKDTLCISIDIESILTRRCANCKRYQPADTRIRPKFKVCPLCKESGQHHNWIKNQCYFCSNTCFDVAIPKHIVDCHMNDDDDD